MAKQWSFGNLTGWALTALSLGVLLAVPVPAAAQMDRKERGVEIWKGLRDKHFGDRPIRRGEDQDVVGLEAPDRAEDPALVPITIRDRTGEDRRITRLWLVIDNNPRPMAATFRIGPGAGSGTLSSRIRINAYTYVRAVAETDDGELHMAKRFVKASGGCAAPISDQEEDPDLGKMRLRVQGPESNGAGRRAHLMIKHPQVTGLQMNQVTRLYPEPHFINWMEVSYGGERVMEADLTFTLSKNPSLRFYLQPDGKDRSLKIRVKDNQDNRFSTEKGI